MDIKRLLRYIGIFAVSAGIGAMVIISLRKRWGKKKVEQQFEERQCGIEEEIKSLENEAQRETEEERKIAEQEVREGFEKEKSERLEVEPIYLEEEQQRQEEKERQKEEERKKENEWIREESKEEKTPDSKRLPPGDRGGRSREPATKPRETEPETKTKPHSLKPETVCWNNEGGWKWIVGIEMPEGLNILNVTQNGERLEQDNTDESFYRIRRAEGIVKVIWDGGEKEIPLVGEKRNYLIFKMRKDWKGPGRLVRYTTTGYYLAIVPQEWERDQQTSGFAISNPESVQLDGYKAHFFYQDLKENMVIGFITANDERIQVESKRPRFQLVGNEIMDASEEMGPLFGEQPPYIQTLDEKEWANVGMIVVGKEGSGRNRWRTQFVPQVSTNEQKLPEEIITRRGGWYFVRIYDKNDDLLESMDFRFSIGLKGISMERYDCLPGPKGYEDVTIQFLHQPDCKVELMNKDKQHVLKITRESDKTIVAVPPNPDCDKTHWFLSDGDGKIEVVLLVERIWWSFGTLEIVPTDWVDKPIALTRKEFTAITDKALWVRLPRPRFLRKVDVGFEASKSRSYQVEVEKKELAVPLRDFCDAEEIQNPKEECLFQIFIDYQEKMYSTPLLQIHTHLECKNCEFKTYSQEEALSHLNEHLSDLVPHLSYEELYERSKSSIPPAIYKCNYGDFYCPSDDYPSPTGTIIQHVEQVHNCEKAVKDREVAFCVISDVDEIRKNVKEIGLPHIYRCQICGEEFEGDNKELRLNHLQENHKDKLFEIF